MSDHDEERGAGRLILVTGGARSGKSSYAERLAAKLAAPLGDRVTYIATSEEHDDEMRQRVRAHRAARSRSWTTVECPLEVAAAVRRAAAPPSGAAAASTGTKDLPSATARSSQVVAATASVILLDCVALWVANLLFSGGAFGGSAPPDDGYNYEKDLLPASEERAAGRRVVAAVDDLLAALAESRVTLVAVTNEVGLGVVPEYPLARLYRDQLGWANQRLARRADEFYLLVSGCALDVKALAVATGSPLAASSAPCQVPHFDKESQ